MFDGRDDHLYLSATLYFFNVNLLEKIQGGA